MAATQHNPVVLNGPAALNPQPTNPNTQRPGVIARLHALFPAPPTPHEHPSAHDSLSHSRRKVPRKFIKVRIMTWNMHESLPKGDLEELLGAVYSEGPNYFSSQSHPTLIDLPEDPNHPYHLVVVASQECPTISGLPRGLGAPGFKLKDKDRDKSKDKDKDRDESEDRPRSRQFIRDHDKDKDTEERERPRSIHRPHLRRDRSRHCASREDTPSSNVTPSSPNAHDEHSHHTPYGWSSMLEDWYTHSNGHTGISSTPDDDPSKRTLLDVQIGDECDEGGIIMSPKAKSTGDLTARMDSRANDRGPYELLVKERMMGLYLAVFIHRDIKGLVQGTSKSAVTAGLIGGRVGNKGAVGISLNLDGTTFLFINAHLAAHEGKMHHRIANLTKIKNELAVNDFLPSDDPRIMAEDMTDRFDHAFVCGDLNFRLDITRLHADWLISRREYAQALAFDQLRKVMESGKAFVGFHEAPIDFPPTFKYDVCRTLKRHRHSRSSKRHSKSAPLATDAVAHEKLLTEIEEREREEHNDGEDAEDDRDGEADGGEADGGEAASMASSAWTSVHSRYTSDADDCDAQDEEEYSLPSSNSTLTRANASTGNLVHKIWSTTAAHKAKSKFVSLISSSVPDTPVGKRISMRAKRKDEKESNGEISTPSSTAPTPDFKTTTFPPTPKSTMVVSPSEENDDKLLRPSISNGEAKAASSQIARTSSSKSIRNTGEENVDEEESLGVYDSSHKKRVPSWCDRILWKSTVDPGSDSEPEGEEEELHLPPLPPRTRMGQILQALRPTSVRSRKDSYCSIASNEATPVNPTSPYTSDNEGASDHEASSPRARYNRSGYRSPRRLSYSRSTDSLPMIDRPYVTRSHTHGIVLTDPKPRSHQSSQTTTSPTRYTAPLPHPLRTNTTPEHSSHAAEIPPPVPPKDPPPVSSRWLANFFPFLSRDVTSGSLSGDNRPSSPEQPPAPPARKGDVVCLDYRSLDDRGMRKLEGRSDHRPVIGSYAVYV